MFYSVFQVSKIHIMDNITVNFQGAHVKLLFSAHISYGKGKYLNQTVFFTKFAKNYCLRNMKKQIHRIQLT